jgi:hypothetical protein
MEPVTLSHGGEIHEISSLGPSEHGEDFVDGELLSGEDWTGLFSFNRTIPACSLDTP